MKGISLKECRGIGDKLIFTFFPENYYNVTGEKLIDLSNSWVFDYNPYMVRNDKILCEEIIEPFRADYKKENFYYSVARRVQGSFFKNNSQIILRHPRLYKYEDISTVPNRITIHTQGNAFNRIMPENFLKYVKEKYSNYEIIQIGGSNDVQGDFIDKRGLSNIWDTVELIASSAIFIGVDSSMLHIANAYPRINRKVLVTKYDKEKLNDFIPMGHDGDYHWLDISNQYYNLYDYDIGVTYSYKKI